MFKPFTFNRYVYFLQNEIGHGASGRVYRALFVPTLKLVVVKYVFLVFLFYYVREPIYSIVRPYSTVFIIYQYCRYIEIKGVVEQQLLCQELKSLYAICYTPIDGTNKPPVAVIPSANPAPPISPYIIKFYGTVKLNKYYCDRNVIFTSPISYQSQVPLWMSAMVRYVSRLIS